MPPLPLLPSQTAVSLFHIFMDITKLTLQVNQFLGNPQDFYSIFVGTKIIFVCGSCRDVIILSHKPRNLLSLHQQSGQPENKLLTIKGICK